MALLSYLLLVCLMGWVNSENATLHEDPRDTCDPWDVGPWGALLEEWATTPVHNERQGRILAVPSANGYYVTERVDGPFAPPPPPPHMHPPGGHMPPPGPPHHPPGPGHHNPGPPHGHKPQSYNEWEASPPTAGGKIVNRPPNPYKDKFKPSYEYTPGSPAPPRPQRPCNAADRADEPPRKQVSETDLYLLGAIEKLVFRVDLMEKRLRKMEENMHYLVVGAETKPEPCPGNFSRVGGGCYQLSRAAADWKRASLACRKLQAALLELDEQKQRRVFLSSLLADKQLKGTDFWTGGLNPGLLWIWSHSARPVVSNDTDISVQGDGRCLALVHDPAISSYVYRGQDCALKHPYICQRDEDKGKLSNDVEKAARSLKLDRKSKLLWDDAV